MKTIPRTLGFASSSERVVRSAVQKAVFMEFTGSWWREMIARASSRAYEIERMSVVMLENCPNSDSVHVFLHPIPVRYFLSIVMWNCRRMRLLSSSYVPHRCMEGWRDRATQGWRQSRDTQNMTSSSSHHWKSRSAWRRISSDLVARTFSP